MLIGTFPSISMNFFFLTIAVLVFVICVVYIISQIVNITLKRAKFHIVL